MHQTILLCDWTDFQFWENVAAATDSFSNLVWYSLIVPFCKILVVAHGKSSKSLGPNRCKRSWKKSGHFGSSWALMYQRYHWRASCSKWKEPSGTLLTSKVLWRLKYYSARYIHPVGSVPLKWGKSSFRPRKLLEEENPLFDEDSDCRLVFIAECSRWRPRNFSSSSSMIFAPMQVTTISRIFFRKGSAMVRKWSETDGSKTTRN